MAEKYVILIVDDTPENLQVLGDMLEQEGYEVMVATNGPDALDNARATPAPDLILLDIMMPGMGGHEVCRRLKADPDLQRIPVIFISALEISDQKIQGFREGGVDYVTKPFQAEEVMARIRTHLQLTRVDDLRREVAERKRAEETLRQQAEELSAIYENSPLIMMIVDESGIVRKINGTFSSFSSKGLSEVVGRHIGDAINCAHAPQGCGRTEFCQACTFWCTLFDTFGNSKKHQQVEVKLKWPAVKDQESFFLLSTTKLIFRDQPAALVCLLDITEQRQLREQVIQQQKLESIGLLVGGIAHDFNNMLLPIICYAEMIQKFTADDQINRFACSISKSAAKAQEMIKQLMTFSRKQTPQMLPYDLNETISSFLKMLSCTIRQDVELRLELPGEIFAVQMDRVQVEQVILNLAVNAQDAIAGKGTISITTSRVVLDEAYCRLHAGTSAGNFILMAFSDSGCGMAEGVLSHIFDPFFTTKPVGKGTGLGLSTVFGIVKQHNGHVEAQSSVGAGTTFRIYLPEYPGDITGIQQQAPAQ